MAQKVASVIIIVVSILVVINFIWTTIVFQNFVDVLKIAKDSYKQANTGFVETVRILKDSAAVERFVFVVRGNIQAIEEPDLTIGYQGSILKINVLPDAQVVRQTNPEELPKTILFSDLKVGDEVSVMVVLEKEGSQGAYRVKVIAGAND